ncbi:hypothetical protein HED63_23200 [Ochrobactrum cytisi]|nr:hypothetical protein [Brucella cytisi]
MIEAKPFFDQTCLIEDVMAVQSQSNKKGLGRRALLSINQVTGISSQQTPPCRRI